MIHWQEQRDEAMRAIASRTAPLKILLKTKDDPFFLEHWIRHHARIVGLENLIVFDNGSTDPEALGILQGFEPALLVLRFTGSHNRLHSAEASRDLYRALADSCRHFVFLDTDESLTLIRGHHHYADPKIVEFVGQFPDATVIPSVWLWSVPLHANVFSFGPNFSALAHGIQAGKPVLASSLKFEGFLNHNFQVAKKFYSSSVPVGLFVLHRARLSPLQRTKANIRKLVARKLVRETDSIEDIVARGKQLQASGNVGTYFASIEALGGQAEAEPGKKETIAEFQFRLRPDGTVQYFSRREMFDMFKFLMTGSKRVRTTLRLRAASR
ncbi:MAG: glycosyltransferase family 2 protein [Panacagrimonas sp.]